MEIERERGERYIVFLLIFTNVIIHYLYMHLFNLCGMVCIVVHQRRSEDNLWRWALFFRFVVPGNQTKVSRLIDKNVIHLAISLALIL